jgi:hypothetical protein
LSVGQTVDIDDLDNPNVAVGNKVVDANGNIFEIATIDAENYQVTLVDADLDIGESGFWTNPSIRYNGAQNLTEAQKRQARDNIGISQSGELVTIAGAQTITGQKTFSVSPKVPTPSADDDSENAVNTEWITDILESDITTFEGIASGQDPTSEPLLQPSNIVTVDGNQTITGNKDFTGLFQHNGYGIEAVVASGTGYIRYESGLQICWGKSPTFSGTLSAWGNVFSFWYTTPISFSVPFAESPTVCAYKSDGSSFAIMDIIANSTQITSVAFLRGGTAGSISASYSYVAIGYWK